MSPYYNGAAMGGQIEDNGAERRWAHRKPCGHRAQITRGTSGTQIGCEIVNMSTTGACLEVKDLPGSVRENIHLPAYFTLAIRRDRMEIDCSIVWRKGAQIGVRFLAAPRPMQRTLQN